MKNDYKIEKVDTLIYTDEDWKRYFDFRAKCFVLDKELMPYASWEELKIIEFKAVKEAGEHTYKIWKNDQESGVFGFYTEFEDELDKRFTYLKYGKGGGPIEPSLLEQIFVAYLDFDEDSKALGLRSIDETNDYVEERYRGALGSISELFELKVKEANLEKIDQWYWEAPSKFPDFRIAFYDEIPDDLLGEYAAMLTQMTEDMPGDSIIEDTTVTVETIKNRQETYKLKDYCIYNYLVFDQTNQLIAMTHVSIKRNLPQEMYQHMTGVKKAHRGQGLSKWIKAAMYKRLVADFPKLERIRTETHPENHASRELSRQMGYQKIGIAKEYLIPKTAILKFLNK